MSKLQRALKGIQPPGIYRFQSGASVKYLQAESARADYGLYYLNGSKIRDKASYLEQMARAMAFPSYFGKNWDALNDVLTDMGWAQPAKGFIVLFQSPEYFMKAAPEDWGVALDIFKTTLEFWAKAKIPYYVLLRGRGAVNFPVL